METTVKHPIMPLIEEAAKYLKKNYVPDGIEIIGYKVYPTFNGKIYIKFKLHARTSVLQFLKGVGVDIDFSSRREVRTSNCNNLEFDAKAELDVFVRMMKYARYNHHSVVSIINDCHLPLRRKVKDYYEVREPRTWRLIRKNVNDKRKSRHSLLPIEKRAMGLA